MKTVGLLLTLTSLYCSNAFAEQCSVNFNYGIVIDPVHIRMLNHGQTYLQINHNTQLFIQGREINLTDKQQKLLNNYALGIRQQVPEIVSIAIEGVDIGLKAVNKVIGGLTGENSASHQKIQEKFEEIKWSIRKRFNHSDQNYYLAPQDFNNFDELFTGEFEQEIEEIVSESIGTILMAVGEAMINTKNENNQQSIEQRILPFDERMETMAKDLKLEIGSRANALEAKAEQFCQGLIKLNEIETEMQLNIAPLKDFNLIEAKS